MKSFYGALILSTFALFLFGGMFVAFDNVKDPSKLDTDSQVLYQTLNAQYLGVTFDELNVTQVQIQLDNEDAFSAEFYSASTDSKKKSGTLDKIKNIPNLIRFSIGQEESFNWAWTIVMGLIVAIVALIGFVIIFRKEVGLK